MTRKPVQLPPTVDAPPRDSQEFTKPAGQWHHGDLRASLIACGTHLLETEGVSALSMRAAARLAGVSPGAPAHHFEDRNGLLAAIAAQAFRDMVSLRLRRLKNVGAEDAPGRLRAAVLAYVEFAQMHPARFHLMFGPQIENRDQYPDLVEAGSVSFALLRSTVAPFVREGEPLTEEQLAFAVWAATHGLATLTIDGRKVPSSTKRGPKASRLAEIVVQFCLAALS